jgi:hypothetical protein
MQIRPQNDSTSAALSRDQVPVLNRGENQRAPETRQNDDILNGKRKPFRQPAIIVLLSFIGVAFHDGHPRNLGS